MGEESTDVTTLVQWRVVPVFGLRVESLRDGTTEPLEYLFSVRLRLSLDGLWVSEWRHFLLSYYTKRLFSVSSLWGTVVEKMMKDTKKNVKSTSGLKARNQVTLTVYLWSSSHTECQHIEFYPGWHLYVGKVTNRTSISNKPSTVHYVPFYSPDLWFF